MFVDLTVKVPRVFQHRIWATSLIYLSISFLGMSFTSSSIHAQVTLSEEMRPQWRSSRIKSSPEPPPPFKTENAYPKLQTKEPVEIVLSPDKSSYWIAERSGRILVFKLNGNEPPTEVMHLGRTVYGLALHPEFEQNGFFFVTSIAKTTNGEISRVSKFAWAPDKDVSTTIESETTILEWPAGGHNGGCIRFGPDGFLYLATGDGSGWADWNLTGQRIDDLLASILRIDVDQRQGDMNYGIPKDNPFVDVKGARPEVYSYGHRNVWKFQFDKLGRLWAGDVGQDLWEMVQLVQKGGNYGWSVREGSHDYQRERPLGPTPPIDPVTEHPHSEFRSITGGTIYEKADSTALAGEYVYGDYDTGQIWAFRFEDGKVLNKRPLADTQLRIVGFVNDPNGATLAIDFASGTLQRLVHNKSDLPTEPFPQLLSETGIFESTKELIPADGVIPYEVNSALWSDGAEKQRLIGLPADSKIDFDAVTYPMPAPGWRFPDGTVLVKTFLLPTDAQNPTKLRRLETRVLHHKRMSGSEAEFGAQVWYGYTYVWNDDQTDARLLEVNGADREFEIADATAKGGVRKQKWRFPSRVECALCHNMSAKYALGVNTVQMNREFDYTFGRRNQLEQFSKWGLFEKQIPALADLPKIVDPHDESASIEARARSYLHANCSHCHRLWGGGIAEFQLQFDLPFEKTMVVSSKPSRGNFGIDDSRIVVPASPEKSMLLHRMKLEGEGHMPHIGARVNDREGIKIIEEWIKQIPK